MMRTYIRCVPLLLFFLLAKMTYAQELTITGRVTSTNNEPLAGVSIKSSSGNASTSTDTNGVYEIKTSSNANLTFTFIGYITHSESVNNRTEINVQMSTSSESIEEVVVAVGYGVVKKSDLTGAVGTVQGEALRERPASNLNQALGGKITGVNVSTSSGRPGGRANIRIRGSSSISTTNNPLYVIDGVIMSRDGLQNGSSPIDYINPNDIASVEVLKDASSTAIYGARGANGVVIVTTKRGTSGGGRATYDAEVGVGYAPKLLPVLSSEEFLAVEELAYENAKKFDPVGWATGTKYTDPKTKRTNPLLFDSNGKPLYNTDWQKEAFRNAITQNHQLAFTNGNEKGSYGGFVNYRNEQGVAYGSWQKRYSARFVFDTEIKDWLKVGGVLSYTDQKDKQVDELGGGGITMMRQVLEALPLIPVRYADGRWASNRDYPGMEGGDNPIRVADERLYYLSTQPFIGNMYANIKLMDGLEFRTSIGTNIINQRKDYAAAAGLQYISSDGSANVDNKRFNSWQFENYFTYLKDFGNIHSINAMLGFSWQHTDYFGSYASSSKYTDFYYQFNNLGAGATMNAPSSGANANGLNSYFTRINYTLLNKYLFTFTGRVDGSSKFGQDNQYAFFPSAAVAWKINEENFLKDSESISNLKLRMSYGATGNSEIPAYRALAGMGNYEIIQGGDRMVGVGTGRIANPTLKWERTEQVDLGLELGLFQNKLNFELDVYHRQVNDMLLDAPIPLSSGYGTIFRNIGSMKNDGIEFGVNVANIGNDVFSWSGLFNFSYNRNQVLRLIGGADIYSGATIIREGEPVGSFWGFQHLGTWSSADEAEAKKYNMLPGDVRYQDINGDGVINDNDKTIIGRGIPDGYGTFSNTFKYKNLSLLIDLQYMFGNDVIDRSIHSAEDRQGIANSYKTVLNAWTESNQNTPIAQVRPINAYYTTNNDSHKVSDASFIRGRNLMLSYTLNPDVVSRMKLDRLRFFASVQNFFVITKYSGYDPEVSNSGSAFDQGFGLYDYPRPRVFTFGLNIGL
ncbi:SusC/RagA family TonB-linked outer membrane protein [Sphingobacterium sp. NPDC055431]